MEMKVLRMKDGVFKNRLPRFQNQNSYCESSVVKLIQHVYFRVALVPKPVQKCFYKNYLRFLRNISNMGKNRKNFFLVNLVPFLHVT